MLTLVITVIVSVIVIILLANTKLKTYDITFAVLGIMLVGILIATGPIYGYHEKVLEEEVELVRRYEDVYVTHHINEVYVYRCKEYTGSGDLVLCDNILRDSVIEMEDENCTNPVLRKYVKKAKTGLFSFCWGEKVEYEFYVPIGAIERTNYAIN